MERCGRGADGCSGFLGRWSACGVGCGTEVRRGRGGGAGRCSVESEGLEEGEAAQVEGRRDGGGCTDGRSVEGEESGEGKAAQVVGRRGGGADGRRSRGAEERRRLRGRARRAFSGGGAGGRSVEGEGPEEGEAEGWRVGDGCAGGRVGLSRAAERMEPGDGEVRRRRGRVFG